MRIISGVLLLFIVAWVSALAADAPDGTIKTLRTPRAFPEIANLAEWQDRRNAIREQILVSAGLWPMPEKTPLRAVISGKIMRDGYSVEKVCFQSYPGFYVGGNLYRPLGKGAGPFPAILDAHGHWVHGRLEDTDNCSAPGRCINFAKQGMIAFAYDMVGYNDTRFADSPPNSATSDGRPGHSFGTNTPANLLWSVTLMGLQTWNSIRALDFLESLPDADKSKLAMTGASGGGTQTFILGAIDDRLAAQAPVNMVSHTMQGGCQCENMPGLRVEFSNMEIDAAAAPRPQILVSATGDWTKTMLTTEGPAIEHIYQLFQASENLRYVQFDFEHNYNQTSRQAVYQWFDRCLHQHPDEPVTEEAFQKEPDEDLLVFSKGKLPADAVTQKDLIAYLIKTHRAQLQSISPTDEPSLANYKRIMEPAWKHTLQLKWPMSPMEADYSTPASAAGLQEEVRTSKWMFSTSAKPRSSRKPDVLVLAHPNGKKDYIDNAGNPIGLARQFLDQGFDVLVVGFSARPANPDQTSIFFNTYNRTRLQEKVRDLVSSCQSVRDLNAPDSRRVVLCGLGVAGLWCLLAAPAADAVLADCGQIDVSDDRTLLEPDLFCPGIRNIDSFAGAPILAAPHPLVMFNVAPGFITSNLRASYRALRSEKKLRVDPRSLNEAEIVAAVLALKD